MNREIKFRAWDKKKEVMIERVIGVYGENIYGCGRISELAIPRPLKEYEIMEYTNTKDKNGSEIYEGDILKRSFGKHGGTKIAVVEFSIGSFFPKGLHKGIWEIIGNIYTNPELLQ